MTRGRFSDHGALELEAMRISNFTFYSTPESVAVFELQKSFRWHSYHIIYTVEVCTTEEKVSRLAGLLRSRYSFVATFDCGSGGHVRLKGDHRLCTLRASQTLVCPRSFSDSREAPSPCLAAGMLRVRRMLSLCMNP